MALYHMHAEVVGRSKGKTSVGASAYRACEKIKNEIDGKVHDFRRKKGLIYKEIITPEGVPEWAKNRATLWNEVEKKENRKNSVFAKDINIALQSELSLEDNLDCIKKWINVNFTKRGLVVDLCIHAPHKNRDGTDNKNLHAHIMATTRTVTSDGWGVKAFPKWADEKKFYLNCRKNWADIVNEKFKLRGINEHIDERTYLEQGIDKCPQQHQGAKATALARKGKQTIRKKYNSETVADYKEYQKDMQQISVTKEELVDALKQDKEVQQLLKLKNQIKAEEEKQKKAKEEENPWETKIAKMTSAEWGSFIKNYDKKNFTFNAYGNYKKIIISAQRESEEMVIQNDIEGITKYFREYTKPYIDEYKHWKNNATEYYGQPSETGFGIFKKYHCSDGCVFDKWSEAERHQNGLVIDYQSDKKKMEKQYNKYSQQYNDCLKKNYSNIRQNLQSPVHQKLYGTIKSKAQELRKTLEHFKPYRQMLKAVQKLFDKKQLQWKNWKQQKKENAKNREIERGGISR